MTTSNGNGNGQRHGATDEKVNISTDPISPKSKKVYVSGTIHPDIRVPFREISLSNSAPGIVNGNGTGRCAWMLFDPKKTPEHIRMKYVTYFE